MSSEAVRLLMLASLCAAATVAAAPGANAASRFDGRWSAVLRTQSGPCQPAYRGAVEVVNGVLVIAGVAAGNGLSGRVSPNGSVRATGYRARTTASHRDACRAIPAAEPGARVWKTVAVPAFGRHGDK
jgi:hypothetical protein